MPFCRWVTGQLSQTETATTAMYSQLEGKHDRTTTELNLIRKTRWFRDEKLKTAVSIFSNPENKLQISCLRLQLVTQSLFSWVKMQLSTCCSFWLEWPCRTTITSCGLQRQTLNSSHQGRTGFQDIEDRHSGDLCRLLVGKHKTEKAKA